MNFGYLADLIRSQRTSLSIAALASVLALVCWNPRLSISGDNAEYILLAQSLAHGDGMAIFGEISQKFPPGFPALLVPWEWMFPGEWAWMKVPSLLAFVGLVWVLARYVNPWAAVLVASSPLLLSFAHQIMADLPFALAVTIGLHLCTRERLWWAGLVVLVVAYYLKTVGAVFIGCALIERYLLDCGPLVVRRHYLRLLGGAALCVAFMAPWMLRDMVVVGGNGYANLFILANPYYPEQGWISVLGLINRFVENFIFYVEQFPALWILLSVGGYYSWLHRRHRLLWLALVGYLGLILLWPWKGERFLVPVIPIILLIGGCGLRDLWQSQITSHRMIALMLMAGVMVMHLKGVNHLATQKEYPLAWKNYAAAAEGLREYSPPDAVICARKPLWMSVMSGRRAVSFPFDGPEEVWGWWDRQHVDYVVIEQLGLSLPGGTYSRPLRGIKTTLRW